MSFIINSNLYSDLIVDYLLLSFFKINGLKYFAILIIFLFIYDLYIA